LALLLLLLLLVVVVVVVVVEGAAPGEPWRLAGEEGMAEPAREGGGLGCCQMPRSAVARRLLAGGAPSSAAACPATGVRRGFRSVRCCCAGGCWVRGAASSSVTTTRMPLLRGWLIASEGGAYLGQQHQGQDWHGISGV
jgi:hypothetical protein